jgi:hypothetical protein
LPGRVRGLARPKPEREQDGARGVVSQAARRFAGDAIGAHAAHATLHQTGPHAPVDAAGIGAADDEGPERTCGRGEFRPIALDRDHGGLEAERAERITYPLEPGHDVARGLQTSRSGELPAEVLARFTKRLLPAASRNPLDQESDELGEPPVRELDPLELGRDVIDLGRTPRSGSASADGSLEDDAEEPGRHEAIETAARDITVHDELGRYLSGREGIAPPARVQEDPPKLRIASRGKAIERHGQKTYPCTARDAYRMRQRRIG